jgi:hypothetical protein
MGGRSSLRPRVGVALDAGLAAGIDEDLFEGQRGQSRLREAEGERYSGL